MTTPPAADDWVGRVVQGRYEVLASVARGTMGSVYRAQDRSRGVEVAVKVLDVDRTFHGSWTGVGAARERFLLEGEMLGRLSHPNTVRVLDVGVEDDTPFLVMEFVDGCTLRELLDAEGRLDPARAVRLVAQVCASLCEAHALGLVHRDLKPANILIQTDASGADQVKVVDFGLVKPTKGGTRMTATGQAIGTPMYMAPEQIRAKPVDPRTDHYALGILLFRMLTGRAPFVEEQMAAQFVAHVTDPVPTFAEVAPDLELPGCVEFVTRRCLEKRPEDRYGESAELLRALRICEDALAHPDPSGVHHLRLVGQMADAPSRRWPLPVALAAAALVVLAGFAWVSSGSESRPAPDHAAVAPTVTAVAPPMEAVPVAPVPAEATAADASAAPAPVQPPAPVAAPVRRPPPAPTAPRPAPTASPPSPEPAPEPAAVEVEGAGGSDLTDPWDR